MTISAQTWDLMHNNASWGDPTSAVNYDIKEKEKIDLNPSSHTGWSQSQSNGPSNSLLNWERGKPNSVFGSNSSEKKNKRKWINLGPTQKNKRKIKLGPVYKEIKRINFGPINQAKLTINNIKLKIKSK
jgi:hypothetical protein